MFDTRELAMLLDSIMVFYKGVEAVPQNDGSDLPAIEDLQHKIEKLLRPEDRNARVTGNECEASTTLWCTRDGVAVALILGCDVTHQSVSEAHHDWEFDVYWYK